MVFCFNFMSPFFKVVATSLSKICASPAGLRGGGGWVSLGWTPPIGPKRQPVVDPYGAPRARGRTGSRGISDGFPSSSPPPKSRTKSEWGPRRVHVAWARRRDLFVKRALTPPLPPIGMLARREAQRGAPSPPLPPSGPRWGPTPTQPMLHEFIDTSLACSPEVKVELKRITPSNYTGLYWDDA